MAQKSAAHAKNAMTVATLTFERNLAKLSLSLFLIIDLKNENYIIHL